MSALEGAAVHALLIGRVLLVRSYLYTVERAVVLVAAVILTVVYSTLDTMIGIIVFEHIFHLNSFYRSPDSFIIRRINMGIHIFASKK